VRVLVCGGRDYRAREQLFQVLDELHAERGIELLIHGGAKGADSLAQDWCARRQVTCQIHRADWTTHGRSAGPIRNKEMLAKGRPDLVVAFPGGRGTASMVAISESAGVAVRRVGCGSTPQ